MYFNHVSVLYATLLIMAACHFLIPTKFVKVKNLVLNDANFLNNGANARVMFKKVRVMVYVTNHSLPSMTNPVINSAFYC